MNQVCLRLRVKHDGELSIKSSKVRKRSQENMSRAASQVITSVDRWQSDFLLIEMTTICFGVKLRKKENQKSDLSVQHFFWNIHRVIASWIFEWLMVEKILLANTITSQFKVIPRKFVHFGKTFSLLKLISSAQKLVTKDHVDDVYNQM